jgi:tetratricopeptide (TPR) repeat protein
MSLRPAPVLACAGLVAAVLAVYGRVVGHGFVAYDTPVYLTENPWVRRGLSIDGLRWAFTEFHAANWHPLTWISHMADVQVLGMRPGPMALENALWHAANACLVLVFLERATGELGKSLLVAALFALHPLHVESVAWIVERKDVLSTFFGLSSLLAWLRWTRAGSRGAYAASLALLALGLLAKPMLVTWPFVLLVLDFWPLARLRLGFRRLALEKVPFLLLSVLSSIATVRAQQAGGAVQSFENFRFGARLANAAVAYAAYLGKTFLPVDLCFYYPSSPRGLPAAHVVGCGLLLLAASAAAIALRRRAPWLLAGWLLFLGTLVPAIGIVQVGGQAMADRYTYVPLLGVFVAVAWSLPLARPVAASAAAVACAALGGLAWRQVGFWKDTRALAEHALAVSPGNYMAHDVLGIELVGAGRLDEGAREFRAALSIAPGDLQAASNLAGALQRLERHAEAETVLRKALALSPRAADLHRRLAIVLEHENRNAEALAEVDLALASDPRDPFALHVRAIALEALGRFDEARNDLARSIEILPGEAAVRMRLARLLLRRGDVDAAEAEIRAAIALDPGNAEAHRGRARALLLRGREAEAIAELRETLRLSPEWGIALGDLAWILATAEDASLRDPRAAVELGERAARASGGSAPGVLDALAAAYAAAGRFELASDTAASALARARENGDADLAARIGKRLSAYRSGSIDRETPR